MAIPPSDLILIVDCGSQVTQRISPLHAIADMPRGHIGKLLKTQHREPVTAV